MYTIKCVSEVYEIKAGFRKGRSSVEQIFVLRQIIEKATPLHFKLAF